jgi:PBP1b-binding outer membrane lipoprotein LpoB
MKKIILIAGILFFLYGCKKAKNNVNDTEHPVTILNQLTAVANGKTFAADTYVTSANVSNTGVYSIKGTAAVVNGMPAISFWGKVKTGTYTFGTLPAAETQSAIYELNKVKYRAISGTMVITEIDTLKSVKKLIATFNFNTDTVKGTFYEVTEGNVIYSE